MRKLILVIIIIAILLAGCRNTPFDGHSIIEWVDFIKWDGKEYHGIHSGILADEKYIGDKVGTVKFKVADNVTNPHYKIRDGDAAFHEKGSEIFSIKGHPNLLAVKDTDEINGYDVYFLQDTDYQWKFENVPIERVIRIEIYQHNQVNGRNQIRELTSCEETNNFLQILINSQVKTNFQPKTENGDPTYYELVLYADEPIAYKFDMQFDGTTYYWYPWETSILSNEIQAYIPEN